MMSKNANDEHKERINPYLSTSVHLPICVVSCLCRDNSVRVTHCFTAHHEAAAHVFTGEQAVEHYVPECICSAVTRVELVGWWTRPPLAARLSPHEGT